MSLHIETTARAAGSQKDEKDELGKRRGARVFAEPHDARDEMEVITGEDLQRRRSHTLISLRWRAGWPTCLTGRRQGCRAWT